MKIENRTLRPIYIRLRDDGAKISHMLAPGVNDVPDKLGALIQKDDHAKRLISEGILVMSKARSKAATSKRKNPETQPLNSETESLNSPEKINTDEF